MVFLKAAEKRVEPPFDAVQLANTFIERFGKDHHIDHLKLQKLAYYAYGWWLGVQNQRLTTVGPQVWKLGPVFLPIYSSFASHRDRSIEEKKPLNPITPPYVIDRREGDPCSQFVDWIWGRYGHYSGVSLSNKTHEPGTPWYKVAQQHNFVIPRFTELPDNEIRPYFHNLAISEGILGESVAP